MAGNFIGTDHTGTLALGNGGVGVFVTNGAQANVIGTNGDGKGDLSERNVISASAYQGVLLGGTGTNGNVVAGNYIGTDASGTKALGNLNNGIWIQGGAQSNRIGVNAGDVGAADEPNLISANAYNGVKITDAGTILNTLAGNSIGTDVTGTKALANAGSGVQIYEASNNTVGGTTAAARNVISGNNANGIEVDGSTSYPATNNLLEGNFIGTNAAGTLPLGNLNEGVNLLAASNNTIGGTTSAARNIISGNLGFGILFSLSGTPAAPANNVVQGNFIGTDLSGLENLGNTLSGVEISASVGNTIGGTAAGSGNVISGNGNASSGGQGNVAITGAGAENNLVQGNEIGPSVTGSAPLGGGSVSGADSGITISFGASNNTIGGSAVGAGNLIVDNPAAGITYFNPAGTSTTGNQIVSNSITSNGAAGVYATSATLQDLALTIASNTITNNGTEGVSLALTSGTTIVANTVSSNALDGVQIAGGSGNSILSNSLFGDGGNTEIELDNGANNNQPAPVLTAAATAGGSTTITGTLQAAPGTSYRIQFFSSSAAEASGAGEGQTLLNAVGTSVTTSSTGNAGINVTLPVSVADDHRLSATATNLATGDTSPFSNAQAILPQVSIANTTVISSASGTTSATFTVSLSAPASQPVTVVYATADGSALAGTDYTAVAPTTLTFAPGQVAQTVAITVDTEPAGGFLKTFTVNLSNPTGATIARGQATGTILGPAALPALVISPATVIASPTGTTTATFDVGLTTFSQQAVTVDYATADGTAMAPGDYIAIPSTPLTFAPGVVSQTIAVTVDAESAGAATKTFTVNLTNPVGGTILVGQATGTIENANPLPTLAIGNTAVLAGPGAPATATFTVTLSAPSAQPVSVEYVTADGTAFAGSDYTAVPPTVLTFAPGQVAQTLRVAVAAEAAGVHDRTFTVNLFEPNGATIVTAQATCTINPSALPAVSIASAMVLASTGAVAAESFVVTLSAPSSQAVTVAYATADGTARAGVDYVGNSGMVTFAPGVTAQTIMVQVNAEPDYDVSKTFSVTLSGATGALISGAPATGTILNRNTPPLISISSATVIAGTSGTIAAAFTVSLSTASNQPVTVTYATTGGTPGTDYIGIGPATLTFAPGVTQMPVMVTVNPEPAGSPTKSFAVVLSNPGGAAISSASGVGVGGILSPGTLPSVSIGTATVVASASGQTAATFTVSLSAAIGQSVSVSYATGTGGVGYVAIPSTELVFSPGQIQQTITVMVNPEPVGSGATTFTVNLSNAAPTGVKIPSNVGFGTILPPSTLPVATISSASVVASSVSSTDATFFVTLSSPSAQTVQINYATADGTATAGIDYLATSGTLTFTPGQTTQTVSVTVNPQPQFGSSRTFSVNLSNPVGISSSLAPATGTIANANALPQVALTGTTVTASSSEPTTATFTVTLNAPSSQPVMLTYSTVDGTAFQNFDYVGVAGNTLTFAPGQTALTVTLTVNAAPADAAKRSFSVRLTNPVGALLQASQATITIVHPTFGTNVFSGNAAQAAETSPYVSASNATVTAAAGAATDGTLAIGLTAPFNQTVSVAYASVDGTAKAGSDYDAIPSTPLALLPGQTTGTVPFMIAAAPKYAPPKSFTIDLLPSYVVNAKVLDPQATITILNPNPPPPGISIADASLTASPNGPTNALFTVTLSPAATVPVTVTYTTAPGTAVAGVDYVTATGTLTFTPNQTQQTITVQVRTEPAGTSSRTFLVTLANPNNAMISVPQATGRIDAVPIGSPTPTPTDTNTNPDDGAVLTNVAVESVYYGQAWSAPSLAAQISSNNGFLGTIVNSTFMDMLTSDYGVGRGTFSAGPILPATSSSSSSTVDDTQIQQFLEAGIVAGTLLAPQPDSLYVVYIPPGVEVTRGADNSSDFSSYHSFFTDTVNGEEVPYVVVVYPGQGNLLQPTEGVAGQITRSTSHELAEAATDPFLDSWKDYNAGPENGYEIADEVEGYDAYLDGYTITTVADRLGERLVPAGAVGMLITPATVLDVAVDGTARGVVATFADADYAGLPHSYAATLTFGNGQTTSGVVQQTAPGQFSVTASLNLAAAGINLNTAQSVPLTVQISDQTDNDSSSVTGTPSIIMIAPPAISIAGLTVAASATSSTTASLTVSLSASSPLTTTVQYTTGDGTARAGTDYSATSGTLTFNPGVTQQTINVTVAAAPRYDVSKTFNVQLSAPSNATIASGQGQATVTIDNPNSLPAVSISGAAVTASATSSTTATFTVNLSGPSNLTTTVNYTTADGTAQAGTDYAATSGTLTFSPGATQQTINVTVDAAPWYDVSKTFSVQLSAASNASIASGQGQATGTINNPNALPALTIFRALAAVDGRSATNSTTATFTVNLSAPSNLTTTVNYTTADGTCGLAGTDYAAASGTLTFGPGATQQTISVTVAAAPLLAALEDLRRPALGGLERQHRLRPGAGHRHDQSAEFAPDAVDLRPCGQRLPVRRARPPRPSPSACRHPVA